MPPRKKLVRRKKPSPAIATTSDHESPAPAVEREAGLADDVKVNQTETLVSISNSNPASESTIQDQDESVGKEKKDLLEIENVDGVVSINESQLETEIVAEIKSIHIEMTSIVDDLKILDDNNNPLVGKANDDEKGEEIIEVIPAQESDINKSPCKNNDALVVEDAGNGDIKGTAEIVSMQTSCENETALTVEDDSMENVDDDDEEEEEESGDDDDIEGDGAENEGDEDQDPLLVEDSPPDNKNNKDIELYVGKLDKDTVEDDLVNVFQQFGELKSTRIVRNATTNKSKGFAFIQFASADQAKRVLSELKDGVEVRGKLVKVSASKDKVTLYLGNICKTWDKEKVVQQLKDYGIEHIETLNIPEDSKSSRKIRGFAFLEFTTHSNAVAAFQRLQKPDAVFGRDISAKVSFARQPTRSSDEDLSQANKVHVEGLTKDWNEEKVKEICNKYGEIVNINLCRNSRNKNKDFGFITFDSPESALACVEGVNNTVIEGEAKIVASIAKSQQKVGSNKEGFRGGIKVDKQNKASASNGEGKISNKNSEPKSSKMKGVLNSQQTKIKNKDSSKHKIKANTAKPQQKGPLKKDGESSKEAESSKMKGDLNSQQAKRKRKVSSEQKLNTREQGSPKKLKNGGEGQNSKMAPKAGSNKRKNVSTNEGREDRGNRNARGKNSLKKQKGNMRGRENDNSRIPKSDTHIRRGHDDYRNSTRYIDPYAPKYAASSASNSYHLGPDSLSARRLKEMEPHAGYIEPASATQNRSYSGYVQPLVRAPHNQHQTVYLEPASTSQSQLYSRYVDRSGVTQSHRGYGETAVLPQVQPYRGYHQSEFVQIAHDPSGLARVVRHDGRGAGVLTYAGGPPLTASSQVRNHTSYYQGGGSYSGAYHSQRSYY